MSLKPTKTQEEYATKDHDLPLDDKENEDKLFHEYYTHHDKENIIQNHEEHQQLSENDISNQIDQEIKSDHLLQ